MVYLPTYIYHKNQPNVSKYTSPMVWYGIDLLHFQKLLPGCIMVWPRPCSVNYRLVAVSLGSCEPCNPTSTYPMTSRHLPLQRGTRREHGKTHKKWNDLGMNMSFLEGVFCIVAWSTMSFSHKIWCMLASAVSNLNSASKATKIDVYIYLSHIEARSVCRRLRLPSSWLVLALAWRRWWDSCRSFDIKHHASSLSSIVKYKTHGINPDQRINTSYSESNWRAAAHAADP